MKKKYQNATKEKWRVWVGNEIRERRPRRYREGQVLLLAGDCGDELELLRTRHKMNVVGVDKRLEAVKQFRSNKAVAIQDELINVLRTMQPAVAVADYTNGFTPANCADVACAAAVCEVVIVNLLRGRETNWLFDEMRELAKAHGFEAPMHRGELMSAWLSIAITATVVDIFDPAFHAWRIFCLKRMKPNLYSYTSEDSSQTLDSVALSTEWLDMPPEVLANIRGGAPLASRRKAAAAKAIITRRQR